MTTDIQKKVELSVILPVGRRRDDITQLLSDYRDALSGTGLPYEFVVVLDGPSDRVASDVTQWRKDRSENVKIIRLSKHFGEATALTAGFDNSSGRIILTLPAYYQVLPSELPRVLEELSDCDMVITWRWPRHESLFGRTRRRVFHWLLRTFTGAPYHDLGCGVRAFRRQVADEVEIYGDQYRFFPILAERVGFRVKEVKVKQSPKDRFTGTYRPREYFHRLLDILTIFFLVRFTKKPLRFFGMVGLITLAIGAAVVLYVILERLFFGVPLAERPALLLSSLLVVLGVQTIALGLIGELVIFTHAADMKEYTVDEIIN